MPFSTLEQRISDIRTATKAAGVEQAILNHAQDISSLTNKPVLVEREDNGDVIVTPVPDSMMRAHRSENGLLPSDNIIFDANAAFTINHLTPLQPKTSTTQQPLPQGKIDSAESVYNPASEPQPTKRKRSRKREENDYISEDVLEKRRRHNENLQRFTGIIGKTVYKEGVPVNKKSGKRKK